MKTFSQEVHDYIERFVVRDDPILEEMERHAKEVNFPYIGPQVGRLLYVLSISIRAKRILEIGSGFGYSAYWFCRAVGPEGEVILTEKDKHDADLAREYLTRAGFADRYRIFDGEADACLLSVPGEFDVIFIDGRKKEYPYYLDRTLSRLRVGGLLIADNVLWDGKVAFPPEEGDEDTKAIQDFNRAIFNEPRLCSTIISMRDGVSISVKLG